MIQYNDRIIGDWAQSPINVDYSNHKDDMIENFDIRYLDTEEEFESKNINTKSFILASFNYSIILNEEDDFLNNNEFILIDN